MTCNQARRVALSTANGVQRFAATDCGRIRARFRTSGRPKGAADGGALEMHADYKYDWTGNRLEKDVWTPVSGTMVQRFAYDGWNPAKPAAVGTENYDVWADLGADGSLTT